MHYQQLPTSSLLPFAHLNNIVLNGVRIMHVGGEPVDAGVAIKHSPQSYDALRPFLTVDQDLVVCAKTVEVRAKADAHLAEVLAAAGDFALTPRGAIMIFLVVRMSTAAGLATGQRDSWSEYVKFLPDVSIPTTWTDAERELLKGTSLQVAVSAKLDALSREFEHFKLATCDIKWCQKSWWETSNLTLNDWKKVDSWFRSRALQFPSLGVGMVPMLDFANHRSGAKSNAYYNRDENGDVILLPREEMLEPLKEGDEITINYGNDKSAAEMVFSYGFVEDEGSALWLVLDISSPADDPLAIAKEAVLQSVPTLKLRDLGSTVEWTSHFIWLLCANEEDGLSFRVLQETSGDRRLQALWDGQTLEVANLADHMETSKLWPVYQLRALALVQERVEDQLRQLLASEHPCMAAEAIPALGKQPLFVASRLRELERQLLEKAIGVFKSQKENLLDSGIVRDYLSQVQAEGGGDEDFS